MHMMHMMQMYFHGGYDETILFYKWRTTNSVELGSSIIAIIILGCLHEGLKAVRNNLYVKTAQARKRQPATSKWSLMFSGVHLAQTLLHGFQLIIGYFLMLIVMTYNVYLCAGVIAGATLGYWLFSATKTNSDNIDCCS